jgi:protein-L-isoaspartate(D-aspartate) O-methyltransferase
MLVEQLREGGRLVIPVGDRNAQVLQLGVKQRGLLVLSCLTDCTFVPFIGAFAWSADAC